MVVRSSPVLAGFLSRKLCELNTLYFLTSQVFSFSVQSVYASRKEEILFDLIYLRQKLNFCRLYPQPIDGMKRDLDVWPPDNRSFLPFVTRSELTRHMGLTATQQQQ